MKVAIINSIGYRIFYKCKRLLWFLCHPYLWNKDFQLNGIPVIQSPENLVIGEHVSVNEKVFIQAQGGVVIESNVTLSYGTIILTEGLETKDYSEICHERYRKHKYSSVFIGEGTWIAANVTILPGAYIPPMCIIAAGAVVVGKLPEDRAIYAGVPAKIIKKI